MQICPREPPVARRWMTVDRHELHAASAQVLADLTRHAREAEGHYRAAAEQVGQLYMSADTHRLTALTRCLDEPMRRAAEIERCFTSLLHELQACAERQGSRR